MYVHMYRDVYKFIVFFSTRTSRTSIEIWGKLEEYGRGNYFCLSAILHGSLLPTSLSQTNMRVPLMCCSLSALACVSKFSILPQGGMNSYSPQEGTIARAI